MWPYAANIAQDLIIQYVQPALEANVPAGFPLPQFTRIDIGMDSVVVERVRVLERKFDEGDTAAVIEADINYDGNPEVELTLSDFRLGVNHAQLKGRVEILLRPLVPHIPLVGGGQIAFINTPEFDFTLTGVAALGNHPWLQGLVHNVSETLLSDFAVLPNRFAFKVIPSLEYFTFAAHPVGVLRFAALSGSGFPSTDEHWFKQFIGVSAFPDVYLCLHHGCTKFQTDHVTSNANPTWENQMFDFVLGTSSASQELRIEAYDSDVGTDDFLGRASIPVSELVRHGEMALPLNDAPDNASPELRVAAKWLPLSTNLRDIQKAIIAQRSQSGRPKHCSHLLLTVDVDEAHNLPPNKRPYVKVIVGGQICATSAAYNLEQIYSVEDPEYERSFPILLRGAIDASTRIEYKVVDMRTGDLMGWAFSSISEAVEASPNGKEYNFALTNAHRPDAKLKIRVKIWAVIDDPPLWENLSDSTQASGPQMPSSS
ncbi:Synaptotagmin [Gracilaria domingensis]|nr:Synaptotagmin [Gracilaria domingensis]